MRKVLLLAAVAVMTTTAVNAQPRVVNSINAVSDVQMNMVESVPSIYEGVAVMATDANRPAKVASKATPTAWYNRPAGSFYRTLSASGGIYYNPYIFSPAYRDVTWPNASANATSYTWELNKYNTDVDSFEVVTSTDVDYTGNFIRESAYAPSLTASDGTNTDTYQLHNTKLTSSTSGTTSTDYAGIAAYVLDPLATMQASSTSYTSYLSPKFFAAGSREGDQYGLSYYSGAKDADGGKTGYWFGRNYSGYNAMAVYIEKPSIPYGLRGVHAYYGSGSFTGDATITAVVYKVEKVATASRGDSLVFGDKVAQGTFKIDTTTAESGWFDIPLTEEEDGLVSEVEPTIDYPVAVVLYGYDNDNIATLSMYISTDENDEGYGDCGFMMHVDTNGTPTFDRAMNYFFTSNIGNTAPTIFVDVEWPLFEYWWSTYGGQPYESTDSWQAPTAGGTHKVEYYSTKSSDYWSVLQEDGSDLPDWLTYELTDSIVSSTYVNKTNITYTAAALPSGVTGRSCSLVISYPGAKVNYTVYQGETGITTVKEGKQVAARRYYNVAGQQSAQPFDGVNVVETVYTDGTTEVQKELK